MQLDYIYSMDTIKTRCHYCHSTTNHAVHGKYQDPPEVDEEREITQYSEYAIVQCLGCDNVRFLNRRWDTHDIDEDGNIDFLDYHYPDDEGYSNYSYLADEDQDELPRFLFDLYEELKITLDYDAASILGGIGLRMIVEAVCLHKKIPGKNLKEKIEQLHQNGVISKNDHEIIDRLREIGNITAHQIKSPSVSVMEAALEAVNHLLRQVYIVEKRTRKLRKKI